MSADIAPSYQPELIGSFDPLASPAERNSKKDGVSSLESLYTSKWHSVNSSDNHTHSIVFLPPVAAPPAVTADAADASGEPLDAVAKLLKEKELKEAKDREEREKQRLAEEARQREAKEQAAAGKEIIPEDTNKVLLPSPHVDKSDSGVSEQKQPSGSFEKNHSLQAAQIDATKPTFCFTTSQDSLINATEYTGHFELQMNKGSSHKLILSDIEKKQTKDSKPLNKEKIAGTVTLTLSGDGKKLRGQLDNESLDFEIIGSNVDKDKALEMLLGF